jgi:hypothetical protein
LERHSGLPRFLDTIVLTVSDDLLQFEVMRMIAASLISVAIFMLWLLAISRQ